MRVLIRVLISFVIMLVITFSVSYAGSWSLEELSCVDDIGDVRSAGTSYTTEGLSLGDSYYPSSLDLSLTYSKLNGDEMLIRVEFLDLRALSDEMQLEVLLTSGKEKVVLLFERGEVLMLPSRERIGVYSVDTVNDTLTARLNLRELPIKGDVRIFKVESLLRGHLMDASACTYPSLKPLKVAFVLHGNQPLINSELFWERFWQEREEAGLLRTLLTINSLKVPVELHLSGVLLANMRWHSPEYLSLLRKLVADGLVRLERGTWAEQIMSFVPSHLNLQSIHYNDKILTISGLLTPEWRKWPICWTPERVIDGRVLQDLRRAGCEATIVDFINWWIEDAPAFQPVKVNGVILFPIDHILQYDMFTLEDGGPSARLRRHLYVEFLKRRDEILIGANDWEFAAGFPFGSLKPTRDVPDRFERLLRWLKDKPWIELTTPTDYLADTRDIKSYQISPESLEVQSYIEGEQGIGSLRAWMYGDKAIEGYAEYKPFLRGSWLPEDIKLERMGDLLGEREGIANRVLREFGESCEGLGWSLRGLRESLCYLAQLQIITDLYETAWHDWSMDPVMERKPIAWWERFWAADLRNALIPIRLVKLLEDGRRGAFLLDLDADGLEEGVLIDEDLIAVIEPVGGYVKLLVTTDGSVLTGGYLNAPTSDGEALFNPMLKAYGTHNVRHRAGLGVDLASAESPAYFLAPSSYSIYQLAVYGDVITAYEPTLEVMKRFKISGRELEIDIKKIPRALKGDFNPQTLEQPKGVEIALSPDYLRLLTAPHLLRISEDGNAAIIESPDLTLRVEASGCKLSEALRDMPYQIRFICSFENLYLRAAKIEIRVVRDE